MYSKINELYPNRIVVADVFAYPTIARLAEYIDLKEQVDSDIELYYIRLPKEYLQNDYVSEESIIEYEFDEKSCRQLQEKAVGLDVFIQDLLLGLYMYLMGDVSQQETLAVQVVYDRKNVRQQTVDFSSISRIDELFKQVSTRSESAIKESIYPIEILQKRRASDENMVLVAFSRCEEVDLKELSGCALLLKYVEEKKNLKLVFEYDSQNVKLSNAEELFRWYIQLIYKILN